MRGLMALLAVVLVLAGCGGNGDQEATEASGAATKASDPTIGDPALASKSQRALDSSISADEPGCSAAVGVEGKVVWSGARGVADLATGAKITTDTVFDIASVSKQFTATAVLLLAGAGKLSLDDPLSNHVSGLPEWATTVNVGQLMHQTSGIPDYTALLQDAGFAYSDRTTQADALKAIAAIPALEFEPGSQFEYSNSNYLLLAEVVQQASGQPLPEFLSAEIFQPLGLSMVLDPTAAAPNAAVPYEKGSGEYTTSTSGWEQIGDGSIQTAPSQLVVWADNYRTGKVGGQKLLDAQLAGAVETGGDDRYGAGIYLLPDGTLEHDGSWAGFLTDFGVSSDRRTAVAVSCNSDQQDPTVISEALGKIWG